MRVPLDDRNLLEIEELRRLTPAVSDESVTRR
jgi:hypothetical protein